MAQDEPRGTDQAQTARRLGGDVQPPATGGAAVKRQAGVGFGKVVMAADLHRPVAGVGDHQGDRGGAGVQGDVAISGKDFAGDHLRARKQRATRTSTASAADGARNAMVVRMRFMSASYRMGWWTVTSLVPSGKVASTCTEWIIPGTPCMH